MSKNFKRNKTMSKLTEDKSKKEEIRCKSSDFFSKFRSRNDPFDKNFNEFASETLHEQVTSV